jgi:hypothetical protein
MQSKAIARSVLGKAPTGTSTGWRISPCTAGRSTYRYGTVWAEPRLSIKIKVHTDGLRRPGRADAVERQVLAR